MEHCTDTRIILTTHLFCLQSLCLSKRYVNTPTLFPSLFRLRSGRGSNPATVSSEDAFPLLEEILARSQGSDLHSDEIIRSKHNVFEK